MYSACFHNQFGGNLCLDSVIISDDVKLTMKVAAEGLDIEGVGI